MRSPRGQVLKLVDQRAGYVWLHTIFVDEKLLNPETDLWGIYDTATATWSNPSAAAPLTVPEAVANAMWNYKFVTYDQSMGVHNSAYTKALLEAALAAFK